MQQIKINFSTYFWKTQSVNILVAKKYILSCKCAQKREQSFIFTLSKIPLDKFIIDSFDKKLCAWFTASLCWWCALATFFKIKLTGNTCALHSFEHVLSEAKKDFGNRVHYTNFHRRIPKQQKNSSAATLQEHLFQRWFFSCASIRTGQKMSAFYTLLPWFSNCGTRTTSGVRRLSK